MNDHTASLIAAGIHGSIGALTYATFEWAYRRVRRFRIRIRPLARFRHWRAERRALPDGTRVRLVCKCSGYGEHGHEGIWTTSWTPRRMGELFDDTVDDYKLTREGDGEETYATREAMEVVS